MKILMTKDDTEDYIHIDSWDTWSMDHTLARIIHPMLIQLKNDTHSSARVANVDVPEKLHRPPGVDEWDLDDDWTPRWNWVLNEMIFAFEQILEGEDSWWELEPSANKLMQKRIDNGLRLFGKYYRDLWD